MMAQQKLYTEEQVIRAIELSDNRSTDEVLAGLTPIELPSDEEINERSVGLGFYKDNDKLIVNAVGIARFRDGAKWLKDKILNQNK